MCTSLCSFFQYHILFQISALQSQLQGDAGVIGKLEQEKTQIMGSFGDLKTRIAALEAQVS